MGGLAFALPRIGFCCGAFDLLHPGHILMLADAADQCDYLVVGLHIDPSLERPDKNKPVQAVDERMMILKAIRYVDSIIPYSTEADLERILHELRPDVRILGADWKCKQDQITAPYASKTIHWHKRDHDWSSSEMRRRVWEAECERFGTAFDLGIFENGLRQLLKSFDSAHPAVDGFDDLDIHTIALGITHRMLADKGYIASA